MQGALFILAAAIAWGLEYPLMAPATRQAGMLVTGACFFSMSSLLLGLTLLVRQAVVGRSRSERLWPGWSALAPTFLVGALGIGANLTGLEAARLTSPVNLAVLSRSDVLFSLLISALVFRERVPRVALVFVPVMLLGVGLLTGALRGGMQAASRGDALVMAAAFFVAANAFAAQRAMRNLNGLQVAFMNCTLNAIMFLSVVACTGSLPHVPAALVGPVGGELVGLGFLAYAFFACYNLGLRTCPAWEARLICLLAPVTTAAVKWGVQSEAPVPGQVPGMLLILSGAAGIVWLRARRAAVFAPVDGQVCVATERT